MHFTNLFSDASLVGKCEAALNWLELLEMDVRKYYLGTRQTGNDVFIHFRFAFLLYVTKLLSNICLAEDTENID